MVDEVDGSAPVETGSTEIDQSSAPVETTQQSGGNPAWEKVRSQLDPISFSKIEPELKSWDAGVQKRIEQANSQFAPYQQIVKDRQPEFLNQAIGYAEMLNSEPERVYQMLGDFLKQTGRMPTQKEATEALDAQDDSEKPSTDPRLDTIAKQQERLLDWVGQQQQAEQNRQAEASLDTAITALQTAHPELSAEDKQEIIRRAAFAAQQTPGKDIDFAKALDGAYTEFSELKNRILTTPRPGDSAPQLVPISGGTPSAPNQQQKSWGQYSNGEIQDFIAAQLAQNKG